MTREHSRPIEPTLDAPPSGVGPGALLAGGNPLPLQSVRVRARICADGARTVVEQRFRNPWADALEVIYLFPLPQMGAVIRFELQIGDRVIHGRCVERGAAEAQYESALSAGRAAGALDQRREDVYSMAIANVPSGAEISVRLELIERLVERGGASDSVGFALEWRFPTVIAPRYAPGEPVGHAGPGVQPDTEAAPDASWLSPPLLLGGGASMDLEVRVDWLPARVVSSLRAVSMELSNGGLSISPSGPAALDRDFLIRLSPPARSEPLTAWTDGVATMVRVAPPDVVASAPRDVLFALDLGAAERGGYDDARRALRAAVERLGPDDRFDVATFGRGFSRQMKPSVPSADAIDRADAWLSAQREAPTSPPLPWLLVLKAVFSRSVWKRVSERGKAVVLISDAPTAERDRLIQQVAREREETTLSLLGVGAAPNVALIAALARVGGGTWAALAPGDDPAAAVEQLAARPVAEGVEILGDVGAERARPEPLSLFPGRPETAYLWGRQARVSAPELGLIAAPEPVDFPIAALWARARIAWLTERAALEPASAQAASAESLALGLEHQIATPHTTWIAVDRDGPVVGAAIRRTAVQPTARPDGWAAPSELPPDPPMEPAGSGASGPLPEPPAPSGGGGLVGGSLARLGELLVREPSLIEPELQERDTGSPDDETAAFLARHYGVPSIDLNDFEIDPQVLKLVPREVVTRHRVVPINRSGDTLILSMADPSNIYAIDDVKFVTNLNIEVVVSTAPALDRAIDRYYRSDISFHDVMMDFSAGDDLEKSSGDAPAVELVNLILLDAIRKNASDIHVEPYEKSLRVRYRIDGVLHEIMRPPAELKQAITSRLKVMAGLDIAEQGTPQDGRIKMKLGRGEEVELRVVICAMRAGEKVVIRLSDRTGSERGLGEIGFAPDDLERLRAALRARSGAILLTGPAGSGKTATLYAALAEIEDPSLNISTVESPVERGLDGINQAWVPAGQGAFPATLRAVLRQDPDVVMVGEIRDRETARIAVDAACTGPLVLSCLHVNDAPSAITRLVDMEVPRALVADAVRLVVSQRLVRVLCDDCKAPATLPDADRRDLGLDPAGAPGFTPMRAVGCQRCYSTGYLGRTALHQVLVVTEPIRALIRRGASSEEIWRAAAREGARTLRASGLAAVAVGVTTVSEIRGATPDPIPQPPQRRS